MFHVERVNYFNEKFERFFKMNYKNQPYLTCEDYTVSNKKFDLFTPYMKLKQYLDSLNEN